MWSGTIIGSLTRKNGGEILSRKMPYVINPKKVHVYETKR